MKLLSTAKAFGLVAVMASTLSAGVLDDFTGDPITGELNGKASDGKGQWGPENSAAGATAEVLFNVDGTLYNVQPITDDASCPREGFDEDGDGAISGAETGCYWGWSMEDGGYSANGLTATLKISNVVAVAEAWNYADAGFIYAFNVTGTGETLRDKAPAAGFTGSESFSLTATIPFGQTMRIRAFPDDYVDGSGLPYTEISGTDASKVYPFTFDEFKPQWVGAPEVEPSKVDAFAIVWTSGGSSLGAEVPDSGEFEVTLSEFSCTGGGVCGGSALVNPGVSTLDLVITQEALVFSGVPAQTEVEIFNLSGELVSSEIISGNASVSLTDLNNGAYVARVTEQGQAAQNYRVLVGQ